MPIETVRCAWLWLESIEDQVPANVSNVIQASKSDLLTRGVAVDLFEVTNQIGMLSQAADGR